MADLATRDVVKYSILGGVGVGVVAGGLYYLFKSKRSVSLTLTPIDKSIDFVSHHVF